jgi:hypothetical protein
MISRRGFLQTLVAAAAGAAANFDPIAKLWVVGATDQTVPDIIQGVSWTAAIADEQAELNDIAMRFARALGERMHNHASMILRQVIAQHTGQSNLEGTLLLRDADSGPGSYAGRGHFTPAAGRIHTELPGLNPTDAVLGGVAGEMRWKLRGSDILAPIGTDLRTGVPFTDCLVGVGTDPETGLSARALRFRTIDKGLHTHVEVAAGEWHGHWGGSRSRRRQRDGWQPSRIVIVEG